MTERPHRRLDGWRVATPVVGLLSGALFVVSAHSSEGTDLRPGRFTDLASMVRYDATRVAALKQRAADLKEQVEPPQRLGRQPPRCASTAARPR